MIAPDPTFARVVVGVNGTAASIEACGQAARIVQPGGLLELVSVYDAAPAVRTGWSAPRVRAELEGSARAALALGRLAAGGIGETALINGDPAGVLLRELTRLAATLVVIGPCTHSRWSQALLGGVEADLVGRARCSVLIARPPVGDHFFPERIVVGIDDPVDAEHTLAVARSIESRFRSSLRILVASHPGHEPRARCGPAAELIDGDPPGALLAAAEGADLLVLGRRSRVGLGALPCASSRLAHRAASSVLLVR